MKSLYNRAKFVLTGEEGMNTLEIIIMVSIILVIATVLFIFRDAIIGFINKATGKVNGLSVA